MRTNDPKSGGEIRAQPLAAATIEPPSARPGSQAFPVIGPVLAGLATAAGPLEQALRCRAESGDVFSVELPGGPPITYLLGTRGYAFMNRLPPETAGIGSVLQLVSVFSRWISRADPSPDYLERLALGGRAFLQQRLRRAETTTELRRLVEEVAAAGSRSWAGEVDLADGEREQVREATVDMPVMLDGLFKDKKHFHCRTSYFDFAQYDKNRSV